MLLYRGSRRCVPGDPPTNTLSWLPRHPHAGLLETVPLCRAHKDRQGLPPLQDTKGGVQAPQPFGPHLYPPLLQSAQRSGVPQPLPPPESTQPRAPSSSILSDPSLRDALGSHPGARPQSLLPQSSAWKTPGGGGAGSARGSAASRSSRIPAGPRPAAAASQAAPGTSAERALFQVSDPVRLQGRISFWWGFSAKTSAMPVTVTRTTVTTTMSSSSGLGSPTIVGSPRLLTQPLGLLRLLQLVSTCVAFSLVASVGAWTGPMGNWSMFTWCFCFSVTLIILIVELCGLQVRFPLSWRNFPITYACYAALFCLSSSIIYPTTYVQFLSHGRSRDHAIAATAFSCIACVAYATEVAWTRARPGEITGYMATVPGLLKVLETFVACIIFAFISDPGLYQHQSALEWCVAVYSICFILAAVAILLNLGDCTNVLPIAFPTFLSGLALISVLLYATALVLWPLYQFDQKHGGEPRRQMDPGCSRRHVHYVCSWDRRLAVAILTGINLLAYLADLVYSARLVFVRV